MISKILNAIKSIFGGGSDSDFEDAQTDPGVSPEPATAVKPAPSAPAPAEPKAEPAKEEPAEVKEEAPAAPAKEEPPAPSAAEPITIKGVTAPNAAALLDYANSASEDDLKAAGIKGAGLKALLGARPVSDAKALGSISGFGKKSIENLVNASK